MAYKVFTNGSTLQASEVNENLMQQSVATFSNETARDAAITSPVQGQVTYIEDSNSYQYWNNGWIGLVPQSGNAIINGAFEINQRNFTSGTTNATFGFDRWVLTENGGGATYSAQTFSPGISTSLGIEAKNFLRLVTTGQAGSGVVTNVGQRIEDVRTFAGKEVTVSFYAKSGSATPNISIELIQSFGSGGSPSATVFGSVAANTVKKIALTGSTNWTRYSATLSVPEITGKTLGTDLNSSRLSLSLWVSSGSDYDDRTNSLGIQSNTFDIWGVQVEAGTVATPFKRNANSLQGELAACQRYYWRAGGLSTADVIVGTGISISSTIARIFIQHPVTMRVAPTSIDFSGMAIGDRLTYLLAASSITVAENSASSTELAVTTASGATTTRMALLMKNSNANNFVGFSAEL